MYVGQRPSGPIPSALFSGATTTTTRTATTTTAPAATTTRTPTRDVTRSAGGRATTASPSPSSSSSELAAFDAAFRQMCQQIPKPLRDIIGAWVNNPVWLAAVDFIGLASGGALTPLHAIMLAEQRAFATCNLSGSIAAEACRSVCGLRNLIAGRGIAGGILRTVDGFVPMVGTFIRAEASVIVSLLGPVCEGRVPTPADFSRALSAFQTAAGSAEVLAQQAPRMRVSAQDAAARVVQQYGRGITLAALCDGPAPSSADPCAALSGPARVACQSGRGAAQPLPGAQPSSGGGGAVAAVVGGMSFLGLLGAVLALRRR